MSNIVNKPMLLKTLNIYMEQLEEKCAGMLNFEDSEAYSMIGTLLQWIIACYDRLDQIKILDRQDKERVLGLKFANNCLKHNISLITLHQLESGATIPQKVDGTGGFSHYIWIDLEYVKIDTNNKYHNITIKQRRLYNQIFKGKAILYTFREDVIKIQRYFDLDE